MATATERLEFRITPGGHSLIRRAAALIGEPVTAFARHAAEERAERIVREHEAATSVPAEFFDAMMVALDRPPDANRTLAAAGARWRAAVDHG
jgi:uncharacterized protein (DUF1778 family)